ncbi:MAG: hypothetical protein FJX74_12355 [Armatimonadetes bacterium]|nr:hypothetical protein [Armatimonadota bacterium]
MLPDGIPDYLPLQRALEVFARSEETQSQSHIKPLHQYIALRLVIEGGFLPDEVTPHPPLRCRRVSGAPVLEFDPSAQTSAEKTVIGGLRTKGIDVVVTKPDLGPVLAVSVKGTGGAFRNLTNRMEEAIGDCTNVHIMYPGLVYGFLSLIRANRSTTPGIARNDVCLMCDEDPPRLATSVLRYHSVLANLTGRRFVRDDHARYEAVGLLLVEAQADEAGWIHGRFPPATDVLAFGAFFGRLYECYDLRYPYVAANMAAVRRVEWAETSPAVDAVQAALGDEHPDALGYVPRLG